MFADVLSLQTQKDVPYQLLKSTQPIDASIVIGSFGSSKGYRGEAFKLAIDRDVNVPLPATGAPKYGKLAEIHHIFKPDPKNPPVIMTLVFVGAVLATLPVLAAIVCPSHIEFRYRSQLTFICSGFISVRISTISLQQ